jgi:hypothetical protein
MNPRSEGVEIVIWLVLLVRVGVLVAIIWYGISEYRRWKKSRQLP